MLKLIKKIIIDEQIDFSWFIFKNNQLYKYLFITKLLVLIFKCDYIFLVLISGLNISNMYFAAVTLRHSEAN